MSVPTHCFITPLSRVRLLLLTLGVLGALLAACGGSKQVPPATPDDPGTWRHRGLWVEGEGDNATINVVGRADNASMGEAFVFPTAEADARARVALYLETSTRAFRERLARVMAVSGKKNDEDKAGGYQASEDIQQGDRQLANQAVSGMQTIASYTNQDTDTFYVLGRVQLDALKHILSQTAALTPEQRAFAEQNSDVVKKEWAASEAEARAQAVQ